MSTESVLRRILTLGAAAAALHGLTACEAMRRGANPERPLWTYRPSGSMSLLYARNIVAPSRRQGEPYERGQPELDPGARRVFVGSSDRGLYAIRAEDGVALWRFETDGFVQCEPLYDPGEDVVYFGSNDGAAYKVNAKNGRLLWRFSTNAEVARRPILERGTLYLVNANDTVLALEAASGKLLWSHHRAPAMGMEIAGYAGALLHDDKIYAAFSDGTVTALDARTGAERWQPVDLSSEAEQISGEVPKYLDVDTTPVAYHLDTGEPVILVGSYEGGVYALDAESGTQIWANPAVGGVTDLLLWSQPSHPRRSGRPPKLPARSLLIASTGTTGLWGLDPETGRDLWRRDLPVGGVSRPIVVQAALMVSTTSLGVFLLSPLDGKIIDGVHTGEGISQTPNAYGRRAYVVTNGGTLLSLHVAPPIGLDGPQQDALRF